MLQAFCDLEPIYTFEGTYDINTLVTGREVTGFASFKPAAQRSRMWKCRSAPLWTPLVYLFLIQQQFRSIQFNNYTNVNVDNTAVKWKIMDILQVHICSFSFVGWWLGLLAFSFSCSVNEPCNEERTKKSLFFSQSQLYKDASVSSSKLIMRKE